MTTRIKTMALGTAACLLLASGPLQAQQDLTEEDVRGFFDSARQDLSEAVQSGEFDRVLDWSRNNIADGATFSVSNEFYSGDERKGFAVASLDKQDMMRFGRAAVGMLSGMQDRPIEDYSLEIEVTDVQLVGPNAATVTARFTESGALALADEHMAAASGREDDLQTGSTGAEPQRASGQTLEFEAAAECSHLVYRGESEDQLRLGMSTCKAETRL
jgi:hypothetical protein